MESGQFGRTAPSDIANFIRTKINGGELGPGDRLPNERELAADLGVARITLREALRLLIAEGYLHSKRGNAGGTYVSDLLAPQSAWLRRVRQYPDQVIDLYEFRLALEPHAARLAALRRTDEQLSQMREAVTATSDPGSRVLFRQADHRFHLTVANASGSPRLAEAIVGIRGELFVPIDALEYQDHFEQNRAEHAAVADAIADRNPDEAEARMGDHISSSLSDLLDQVSSMRPSAPNR